MSEPLHNKYRPRTFADVRGQDAVVKSLQRVVKANSHHALLFTGPSGTGKTTLARIAMAGFGCGELNLREVDAATHTGIEAMRAVTEGLHYAPMGGSKARGVIIDEAHALSKAAWQSLLKLVEEPPAFVYWAFCTTEPGKVPATIRTRCAAYELQALKPDDIFDLLEEVAAAEGLKVDEAVLALVADKSGGSPRQALVYLAQVGSCADAKEAATILRQAEEAGEPVLNLCRALAQGERDWKRLMALVAPLADENVEGVRIQVAAYFSKVVLGAKSRDSAGKAMEVLDAFSDPYPAVTGCYPLLGSLARVALG